MKQEMMKIGEVAAKSDVNIQTIRYYERRGLLPIPPRTGSNYRLYSEEAVRSVRFVQRAQDLGFTLKEIKELLALKIVSGATSAKVRMRAEVKLVDIEERIRVLRAMRKSLRRLTAACSGRGSVSECPILDSLDKENVVIKKTPQSRRKTCQE